MNLENNNLLRVELKTGSTLNSLIMRPPETQVLISQEDINTGMYQRVKTSDPKFWDIARYYTDTSRWEGKDYVSTYEYFCKVGEVYGQLELGAGYMYILECRTQPGIYKIGCTERTPADRVKEINAATGVIIPWVLVKAFPCMVPRSVEKLVHERLAEYRVDPKKEGFTVTPEFAENTILSVIEETHTEYS